MTHDSSQGTQYLDPLASPFSGPLTQELKDWGWEHQEENYWCEFAEEGYSRAFAALGISDKSFDEGGDNMCYTSFHYDSENVFDPEDPDEPDDTFPEKDRQWYLAPNGRDMRVCISLKSGQILSPLDFSNGHVLKVFADERSVQVHPIPSV